MHTNNPADPTPSGTDALVRAESTPDGDCPQCPQPQNPQTTPTALVDIGRLSPNPSAPGPKTEAGKSVSSRNTTTHGLRAKKLENAVPAALQAKYEKLRQQYLDDYRPQGAIENTLFDMVVFAAWQLYKVRQMEMFTEIDLGMMGSFGRSEKLARYRASHERLMFRSLNQLKQIQQERAFRETDQKAALPAHLAPGVRTKPLHDHLKRLQRHPKTQTTAATRPPGTTNAKSGSPKAPPPPANLT